jgi:CspA family cold shock protein
MTHGTVKFFNATKGFGFITPDGEGKDIFVAAASVSSAGIGTLKPGQRVSFEIKPDTKGPVAVNLGRLAEPPRPEPAKDRAVQAPHTDERQGLRFYFDPADQTAQQVLEALRGAGLEPKLIDYMAATPTRDELKSLASLLGKKNQSFVRKYAPLFYDLRLDDRFLSQNEFWDAIVEHPSLINGPIIATAIDANLCGPKSGIKEFLATSFPNAVPAVFPPARTAESTKAEEALPIAQESRAAVESGSSVAKVASKARKVRSTGEAENAGASKKTKSGKPIKRKAAAKSSVTKSAKKPKASKRRPKK